MVRLILDSCRTVRRVCHLSFLLSRQVLAFAGGNAFSQRVAKKQSFERDLNTANLYVRTHARHE